MLKLFTSKPFIGGMIGLAIMTTIYFGYRHYNNLLADMELLQARHTQIEVGLEVEKKAVVVLKDTIETWEASQKKILNTVREMQEKAHEATKETRRLQQLFSEIKLEDLSADAADSVANDVSDRLWDNIYSSTSSIGYGDSSEPPGKADPANAPANNGNTSTVESN